MLTDIFALHRSAANLVRLAASIATASLAPGCARLPPARLADPGTADTGGVAIVRSTDGRMAAATVDVLTFNIEGLGWPARRNRPARLQQIGTLLKQLNASGDGPDVVLVQEMFSPSAVRAMTNAGYPYQAWGPSRTQRRRLPSDQRMRGPARIGKGETGFHLVGSGLAILSRFPIVLGRSEPFGTRHCAGLDCLSNKGVQYARIVVPGVPQALNIFNAHLNSRSASRVPPDRSGAAHALQVADLNQFVGTMADQVAPAILGGDFNMRGDARRLARFDAALGDFTMVHRYCTAPGNTCDVQVSWDGDAPWMDTEDLQLFRQGTTVSVRPVRVAAMFDGSEGSPQLSDHDGFRVTYRLSWNIR